MAPAESLSLRTLIGASGVSDGAWLQAADRSVAFDTLKSGTIFSGHQGKFNGKAVLVAVKAQLDAALALIELDGVASRLVVCPPDFTPDRLASVIEQAEVDILVGDGGAEISDAKLPRYSCSPLAPADATALGPPRRTEWVLPTSGTTGAPKLVAHHLEGLLGAVGKMPTTGRRVVWATFYDIRRYGGLQILLRALVGGSTLVLSDACEPLEDHLLRCQRAGVTHMSGTPSHWRRLLMSPYAHAFSPQYVRLSGEIADHAVLESLQVTYPDASVGHAYASTEAGVAFEVTDGLEGFPASLIDAEGEVALRVKDGSLRIRSPRTATRYVGRDDLALFDEDGFVDTDDMVERRGDRCFFQGRRTGVINIGGLKVHPEEVESVINLHSDVRMSLVMPRRNPIMGNVIVAYVVLKEGAVGPGAPERRIALTREIVAACQERLERHKIPAVVDFVPSLDLIGSGKLARRHA
jgi:acyl-coenzyme A synthetase/AMP-(fatty) acid ligase